VGTQEWWGYEKNEGFGVFVLAFVIRVVNIIAKKKCHVPLPLPPARAGPARETEFNTRTHVYEESAFTPEY